MATFNKAKGKRQKANGAHRLGLLLLLLPFSFFLSPFSFEAAADAPKPLTADEVRALR